MLRRLLAELSTAIEAENVALIDSQGLLVDSYPSLVQLPQGLSDGLSHLLDSSIDMLSSTALGDPVSLTVLGESGFFSLTKLSDSHLLFIHCLQTTTLGRIRSEVSNVVERLLSFLEGLDETSNGTLGSNRDL